MSLRVIGSWLGILGFAASSSPSPHAASRRDSSSHTPDIVDPCDRHRPTVDTATSGWVQYGTDGIYRDIDLSGCGFTSAPIISSSLAGSANLWTAQGGSALYSISATGFRTYVYLPGITPSKATGWNWNINWIAHPMNV